MSIKLHSLLAIVSLTSITTIQAGSSEPLDPEIISLRKQKQELLNDNARLRAENAQLKQEQEQAHRAALEAKDKIGKLTHILFKHTSPN